MSGGGHSKADGGGIRKKDGVNLKLDIVYYTFRPDLVTMAPLIKENFIALGIEATIRVNDDGNFMDGALGSSGTDAGSGFDLLLWAQHTLPAGDPYWFLNTFFRSSPPMLGTWGQQNFAQINSTTIDAALDAITTSDGETLSTKSSDGHAWSTAVHTAHDAILAEYPVTFLSVAVFHVAFNGRMSSYEPWGSDYYIIKEDMPASICSVCTDLSALIPVGDSSGDSSTGGLHVTIGVLAGVTFLVLITIVILYTIYKKKASAVSHDKGKPKEVSAA